MHVQLKDVEAGGGFQVLPSGEYAAKLIKHEEYTAQSGNPCVKCTFEVVNSKFAGQYLFDNFTLVANSLWKLKQFALAVNFPATDAEDGFDTDELFYHAENEVILLTVSKSLNKNPKTGKEQERNNVDGYKSMETAPTDDPFGDDVPL